MGEYVQTGTTFITSAIHNNLTLIISLILIGLVVKILWENREKASDLLDKYG